MHKHTASHVVSAILQAFRVRPVETAWKPHVPCCKHVAVQDFEGNSQVTFFDGNYQEYEADKKKRLGEEGAKPKRIRYKPLTV